MKRPTMVGVCKRTPPCLANMANYVNGSQDEKLTLKFFRQLSTWVCARPQMLQQMEYGKGTYPKGIWLFLVLVFVFAMFCKFKRNLRIKSVKKKIRSSAGQHSMVSQLMSPAQLPQVTRSRRPRAERRRSLEGASTLFEC